MAGKLTGKQEAFCQFYVDKLNATEAARLAEYKGSYGTLRSIGSENLTKPNIKARIAELMKAKLGEQLGDEVLLRLRDQATASIAEFFALITEDQLGLDPQVVRSQGHLIKRIRVRRRSGYDKQGEQWVESNISLELHDQQKALELLGKYYKLFVERHELEGGERPVMVKVDR